MNLLPEDILMQVFSFLTPRHRLVAARSSRSTWQLLDNVSLLNHCRVVASLDSIRADAARTFQFPAVGYDNEDEVMLHAGNWNVPLPRLSVVAHDTIRMAEILLDETGALRRPSDELFPFWWHALHVSNELVFDPGFEPQCWTLEEHAVQPRGGSPANKTWDFRFGGWIRV